jgi:hypothetical protein
MPNVAVAYGNHVHLMKRRGLGAGEKRRVCMWMGTDAAGGGKGGRWTSPE